MDRNKYYGGDSASLSPLDEVCTFMFTQCAVVICIAAIACVFLGLVYARTCTCMCATASTNSQVSLFLDFSFLVDG